MNTTSKTTTSRSRTTSQMTHPQNNTHGPNSMTTATCSDTDTPSQTIAAFLDIGMVSGSSQTHTIGNSHQRQQPHPHTDTQLQRQQLPAQRDTLTVAFPDTLTTTLTHRYPSATTFRDLHSQTTTPLLDTDSQSHKQPFSDLHPSIQPSEIDTRANNSCTLSSRHPHR